MKTTLTGSGTLLTLILLALSSMSGLPSFRKEKTGHHKTAPDAEQLAVYGALLDTFSSLHVRNLADETAPLDLEDVKDESPCLRGIDWGDLRHSAHSRRQLTKEITNGRDLALVDPIRQTKVINEEERGQPDKPSKQQDPKSVPAQGFLILSDVAFDTPHQHALVQYTLVCGSHCRTSQTFLMEKVGANWKIKGRPCSMRVN